MLKFIKMSAEERQEAPIQNALFFVCVVEIQYDIDQIYITWVNEV